MEKITLKDLAKMANVSAMTVSNVLRGKDARVAKETKEKIELLVKKYNYVPNQNASSLRSGKSKLIGVLFYNEKGETDFTDPFIASVLTGLKKVAKSKGYFTMIHSIRSKSEVLHLQQHWMFAGFIVIGVSSKKFVEINQAISVPVSYIDTYWKKAKEDFGEMRNFIETDEEKVSQLVADYLTQMGHQRVLFYSFRFNEEEPSVIEKRYHAFLRYFSGETILLTTETSDYQEILKTVEGYLWEQPFTAIYATADILAVKLNQIFKELSIIGVDNAEFDEFVSPKLTTIAIDQVEKGKMAMRSLLKSVEKGETKDFISEVHFIERDSVQKNRQKKD